MFGGISRKNQIKNLRRVKNAEVVDRRVIHKKLKLGGFGQDNKVS